MAEYKTLGGLDLDIGGFTESVTSRSKKTLEEVSRKNRGIGAKPETEEIELDDNFLKGIAQLFRDNGYEPTQPSEDVTTTPKDEVLDEYSDLMKSEIIQDVMKEVSTLGESPNKLEDIYTSMDTDFVTLENQPTVDSEGELLEIEQTEPLGLMSKVSPVVTSDKPVMAETPIQPDLKADVDTEILNPRFLNAIGITGSLTEKGVQTEVKKVLKEQGMSDEEIANLVNKSLAAEVQPTDIPEYDNVDFDFIKEQEGFRTDMYVPKIDGKVLENSGPTIASGFDLGQRNESDLKGLPKSLINKLKPYLGKKKKEADDFVKNNSLTITKKEADIINSFAKKQELDRLIKAWNNSSDVKWKDLSTPQATTVASVAFQFGNLPTRTPNFWRYTTTGDWAKARDELRDFYGKNAKGRERQRIYGPRRNREADYLEQDNAAILGTRTY